MKTIPKRCLYILIPVILLAIAIILCLIKTHKESSNRFVHKTFSGTILSYAQTDNGLTFTLDNDATVDDRVFIITEDTMFTAPALEKKIKNQETGIYVVIESEFWTYELKDLYPATIISPAE